MSRYFNSFMDDSSEELEHSWGTSPRAKAREKEYNHWYYQKHKDEFAAIRKQRIAATNSYQQAAKSHDDARRYEALSGKMQARISGWNVSNMYKDPVGDYRGKVTPAYPRTLKPSDVDMLRKAKARYTRMSTESEAKSRKYKIQGDEQMTSARTGANRFHQHIKNPTVKDLVEFYLDTTVEKAKKSASKAAKKAKKYATKAMSTAEKEAKKYATKAMPMAEKAAKKAEKYATKAMSTAEKEAKKYVTKAMPMVEKAANKAKRYATKTVKSVIR